MQNNEGKSGGPKPGDGRKWQIGTAADVDWIARGTTSGLTITSGVPPIFAAYATVVLPTDDDERQSHDRALIAVLSAHSATTSWWLGYLDTGSSDIVFPDAPKVVMPAGWHYVLVAAGPEQAARWRKDDPWKGALPDLMFPANRSWLISTLWDDDWTCVGGSSELVNDLLSHPDLLARSVTIDEDATPPGHTAI